MSRGFYKRVRNVTQHTVQLLQAFYGPFWAQQIKCTACSNKVAKVCCACNDIVCSSCNINEIGHCTKCQDIICDSCRVTCECQKTRICHACVDGDDTPIKMNYNCIHCKRISCTNDCSQCDDVKCIHCGSTNNLKFLDCKIE